MRVVAIASIRNVNHSWEENFDVESEESAVAEVKEVIDDFNASLRPGELKREFVEIVRFEYPREEILDVWDNDEWDEDDDWFDHDDESF